MGLAIEGSSSGVIETRTVKGYGMSFTGDKVIPISWSTNLLWLTGPTIDEQPPSSNDGKPFVSVVDMGSPEYQGISVESDMSSIDTYGRQRVVNKG